MESWEETNLGRGAMSGSYSQVLNFRHHQAWQGWRKKSESTSPSDSTALPTLLTSQGNISFSTFPGAICRRAAVCGCTVRSDRANLKLGSMGYRQAPMELFVRCLMTVVEI
ncbi:hypothetical protein M407DRAFT_102857 [Tulasnella calospora MUT 4182]|uniref:Uncharacterized protein n=1 Tax=Tulasnella calospora MUT 4182 TaxID=1051891 RepID=A0A0C3KS02_9AGAM|nr:hypothetical protein M407DRAFT_102857 [Tulasnella calospora MUT 4182]